MKFNKQYPSTLFLTTLAAILLLAFVFLATPVYAEKDESNTTNPFCFNVDLDGGWSSWRLDDFETSRQNFNQLGEFPGNTVATQGLSGSFFGGFDLSLEYNLNHRHSIGLSAGVQYFPGGTFEQNWSGEEGLFESSRLDLSAFSIPVELYYKLRAGSNLSLRVGGGLDFFQGTVDCDFSANYWGEEYALRGKLKDSDIGGHVSLGAEYHLSDNISLSIDAGYAFAKLNNITGSLSSQDGTATDMELVMVDGELGEMLSLYPTAEPLPAAYRPAELDYNGPQFSLGLKYYFGNGKPHQQPPIPIKGGDHDDPGLINWNKQVGTSGNDVQEGIGNVNNEQYGGQGDDRQTGGFIEDTQYGGQGDDEQHGGAGDDRQFGGQGDDIQHGDDGNDTQRGGQGDDEQHGGSGNDKQYGGQGDDIQHGDDGNDTQRGGQGDDEQHGGSGDDKQYGGQGEDEQHGDEGDDRQYGGAGNDEQYGGQGNDEQHGDEGDDKLYGGDGDDSQYGGDGDDQIYPGTGNGFVDGGNGNDTVTLEGTGWGKNEDGSYTRQEGNRKVTIRTKNVERVVDGNGNEVK